MRSVVIKIFYEILRGIGESISIQSVGIEAGFTTGKAFQSNLQK